MNQSKMLNYLLGTTSKVEILRVLFESDVAMTGRRIASTAGISPRSCQLSLDNLVQNNVLFRQAVGRAYSYTLNRDHKMLWEHLQPLFLSEKDIHKGVGQLITRNCKKEMKEIESIFWKVQIRRKREYLHAVFVLKKKAGFPAREFAAGLEEAIVKHYGYAVKIDMVGKADFPGKYFASKAAAKRFPKEFARLRGATYAELTGEKKTGKK